MALDAGLFSLGVALIQQLGIVLGVGAQTILLTAHFLALHSRRSEEMHGYVHTARQVRAVSLMLIILSGVAAVIIHLQTGTSETLFAPAFIFKWGLIGILALFHMLEEGSAGYKQDAIEGFEGTNWYALFIVHTMAPVVSWAFLLEIYGGWFVAFGTVWVAFVAFMRWQGTTKAPNPMPAAPATPLPPKPAPAAVPIPVLPKLQPQPQPTVATPPPAPIPPKIEVHPNHSLLPMIAELDLPAPKPIPVPPTPAPVAKPQPVAPTPTPPPVPTPAPAPEPLKPEIKMPDLEDTSLPGIRVMPKRPEDIETSNRPSAIQYEQEKSI